MKSLLQSCDICLIQEHWLFQENLDSLRTSNDFLSVGVSGMDSSQFLAGLPFGGCCILYRKTLSTAVRRIFTHSKRFCAISITFNNIGVKSSFVVLLVCIYLPTDYSNAASQLAFSESLCELNGLISAEHFDDIIIAFNVDFARSGPNCSNLSDFMSSNNLVSVDQMFNINYTYHKDDFSCFSSPDHILTTSNYSYLILFTIQPKIFPTIFLYILLSSLLVHCQYLSVYAHHVHLATLILLVTSHSLSTGIKLLRMISYFTVITSFPLYLNFLLISSTAVILTAPLINRC